MGGGHIGERVAADRADRNAVHQYIGDLVAGVSRGDGEALIVGVVDADGAAGRDGALVPAVAVMVNVLMAKLTKMSWPAVTLVKV